MRTAVMLPVRFARQVGRGLWWLLRLLGRFFWWLLLLALIAAGVWFLVLPRVTGGEEDDAPPPPEPVPAVRQDLRLTVPAVGSIDYGSVIELGFAASGVIASLNVTEGGPVSAGDTLATLERDELARKVEDAEASLRRAQLDLADLLADPTPTDLRQTELDLDEARAALDDLDDPPGASSVAAAESGVSSAQGSLITAQSALDDLLDGPTPRELADAESSLASARSSLVSAQSSLSDLQAGPTELQAAAARDNLAGAREALAGAREALTGAREALAAARRNRAAAVADHPSNVTNAEATLANRRAEVISATTSLQNLRAKPTPDDVRSAEIELEQARLTHDDTVRTGARATAAQKEQAAYTFEQAQRRYLKALEPATAEELAEAEARLTAAQANLAVAETTLADLLTGPDLADLDEAVTAAERSVASAERGEAAAERSEAAAVRELDDLRSGPSATDLAARRASVASAMDALAAAEQRLADLQADPDPNDVKKARLDLAASQSSLADAQARLADLMAGANAVDRRKAEAAVVRAEIALDKLRLPPDQLDVERRELAVTDARRALESARTDLVDSVITAPIDGVVLSVDNHVGERVSGAFIKIGAAGSLRARVSIDESDIGQITVGQPVELTFIALDDRPYRGEVSWIAVQGEFNQGLVTFDVDIALREDAQRLRAGLSSNMSILIDEVSNVLAVPKAAVRTTPGGGMVVVVGPNGVGEPRQVQTGLSDTFMIEIVDGLQEGELVMPNVAQALADLAAGQAVGAPAGIQPQDPPDAQGQGQAQAPRPPPRRGQGSAVGVRVGG